MITGVPFRGGVLDRLDVVRLAEDEVGVVGLLDLRRDALQVASPNSPLIS
jgi:hypothetical protein